MHEIKHTREATAIESALPLKKAGSNGSIYEVLLEQLVAESNSDSQVAIIKP